MFDVRSRAAGRRRSLPKLSRAVRCTLDSLEPRRLLAATLDDGELIATGTDGADDLRLDRAGSQIIVTLNGVQDGSFDEDDVEEIVLRGLGGNDTLRIGANIGASTLNGGDGDDTLLGGNADDRLNGQDGNDTLDGKEGSDDYAGGDGFDSADYRFETANLTLSIDGEDNEQGGNADGDDIGTDVERIVGGQGSDDITGSDADNSLDGRGGNDTINGGLGNDSIDGGDGNDQIGGQTGDDVLTGNPGNDTLTGGPGDDRFITNDGDPDTLDGNAGNDSAVADQPGDTFTSIESGINIPAPEVEVRVSGGANLTDNFSTVGFGSVQQGQLGPARTFTVTNSGTDVLSVGGVVVPAGFVLTDGLSGPIQPGGSASFTIRVDTSVAGDKGGTVSFANSDADENPFNFDITATVTPAPPQLPDIRVRTGGGANIPDGSNQAIGFGSADQGTGGPTRTFTVFNDGDAPLTVGSVSVPAGFTVIEGLQGPITPGDSNTFTVRMDTGVPGAKAGDIVITTNDPDEDPFNFAISGTVVAVTPPGPEITVTLLRPAGPIQSTASTVEFGNRVVNSKGPTRTFRVRNDGDAPLDVGTVSVPPGFLLTNPLTGPIAPGEVESFTIQLDTRTPGSKDAIVTISTNDGDEAAFTIRVVGTVGVSTAPTPELTMRAFQAGQLRGAEDGTSAFSFGTVVANSKVEKASRRFRLSNDGNGPLTIRNVKVSAGFVILNRLPRTLAPGASDELVIAVDTKAGLGNKAGQFSFTNNDANENPFSFGLIANVVRTAPTSGTPEITVTSTSGQVIADGATAPIGFGSVARNSAGPSRTFRVRNAGSAPLNVGAVSVPAGFSVTDPLLGPIAPGQTESFTVRLDTGSTGNRGGNVQFTTNDANENPFSFAIAGTVVQPPSTGPAVTASLSGGTLTVNGTAGIDTIAVGPSGGGVGVVGNGAAVGGSPFSGVQRIVLNGFDGDDRLDAANLALPVSILGGNGNDVLIGGSGNDSLSGGGGNDNLFGNRGIDVMRGDDGADTINANDGIADAIIDGGGGNDVIRKDRVDPGNGT